MTTSPLKPRRHTRGLSRRPALRHSSRTTSTDSTESIWFSSATPPRSIYTPNSNSNLNGQRPPTIVVEDTDSASGYDTPPRSDSSLSFWTGSTDTWLTARSRIRIYLHDPTAPTQELFVGPLYEVISYIWDTICHTGNITLLTDLFTSFATPRSQVIDLVTSSSISLPQFLKTTDLEVHINPPSKPRYTI